MWAKKMTRFCLLSIVVVSECCSIACFALAFTPLLTGKLATILNWTKLALFVAWIVLLIVAGIRWKINYFKRGMIMEAETWRVALELIMGGSAFLLFILSGFHHSFVHSCVFQAIAYASFYIDAGIFRALANPKLVRQELRWEDPPVTPENFPILNEEIEQTKEPSVFSKIMWRLLGVIFIIIFGLILLFTVAGEYIELFFKLWSR